jgi:hypothetical protein
LSENDDLLLDQVIHFTLGGRELGRHFGSYTQNKATLRVAGNRASEKPRSVKNLRRAETPQTPCVPNLREIAAAGS